MTSSFPRYKISTPFCTINVNDEKSLAKVQQFITDNQELRASDTTVIPFAEYVTLYTNKWTNGEFCITQGRKDINDQKTLDINTRAIAFYMKYNDVPDGQFVLGYLLNIGTIKAYLPRLSISLRIGFLDAVRKTLTVFDMQDVDVYKEISRLRSTVKAKKDEHYENAGGPLRPNEVKKLQSLTKTNAEIITHWKDQLAKEGSNVMERMNHWQYLIMISMQEFVQTRSQEWLSLQVIDHRPESNFLDLEHRILYLVNFKNVKRIGPQQWPVSEEFVDLVRSYLSWRSIRIPTIHKAYRNYVLLMPIALKPYYGQAMTKVWKDATESKAGIGLQRKVKASTMAADGVPLRDIAKHMQHSIGVCDNYYVRDLTAEPADKKQKT